MTTNISGSVYENIILLWLVVKLTIIMACSKNILALGLVVIYNHYINYKIPVNRKGSDIWFHDWKHTVIMACRVSVLIQFLILKYYQSLMILILNISITSLMFL